jgi:hypothetical protein
LKEDLTFTAIRKEIEKDCGPVRPLLRPWQRALLVGVTWLFLATLVVGLGGLRSDYPVLGAPMLWSSTLAQIGVAYALIALALRLVVPAQLPALSLLLTTGVVALATFTTTSGLILLHSRVVSSPSDELSHWLACLTITTGLGLAPAVAGFLLGARGLPQRPRLFGLLCGLAAGIGAEAVWRLHCPYSDPEHILGAHGGAILILALLGLLAGRIWERKERRGARASEDTE